MKVDKAAKVFNVCDGFIVHAYKSHLLAAVCTQLKLESPDSLLMSQPCSGRKQKQKRLFHRSCIDPISDPVYGLHHTFLHIAFLYVDLRSAIQFEEGEHIIRH